MMKISRQKKLSILPYILVVLLFVSCSKVEPDFVVDTKTQDLKSITNVKLIYKEKDKEIEVTTDFVKEKWEKGLNKEGLNVKLQNFEILESFDSESNQQVYFLRASSSGHTIQTGAFLNKSRDGVYTLGAKQCTCEGCPTGCSLIVNGTKCSCSPCPGSNKSCTKTETIIIDP